MRVAVCIQDFPKLGTPEHYRAGDEVVMDGHGIPTPGWIIKPCEFPHFWRIEERTDGPWRPKEGDAYCFIESDGSIVYTRFTAASASDHGRADLGNCFKTKTQLEAKLPAVRNALNSKSLKDVLDAVVKENGWKGYLVRVDAFVPAILAAWEGE